MKRKKKSSEIKVNGKKKKKSAWKGKKNDANRRVQSAQRVVGRKTIGDKGHENNNRNWALEVSGDYNHTKLIGDMNENLRGKEEGARAPPFSPETLKRLRKFECEINYEQMQEIDKEFPPLRKEDIDWEGNNKEEEIQENTTVNKTKSPDSGTPRTNKKVDSLPIGNENKNTQSPTGFINTIGKEGITKLVNEAFECSRCNYTKIKENSDLQKQVTKNEEKDAQPGLQFGGRKTATLKKPSQVNGTNGSSRNTTKSPAKESTLKKLHINGKRRNDDIETTAEPARQDTPMIMRDGSTHSGDIP